MSKSSNKEKSIISVIIVLTTFTFLLILDSLLGFIRKNPQEIKDIFYLPPNANVTYKTPEFNIEVKTNSLGFRGKDYPFEKGSDTIRILAVGDSFTYGWSVNLSDSWVYLLEKGLNKKYKKKFEVMNFGKSGASPQEMLETAKKYIPIYEPDYVLVGILEGSQSLLMDWEEREKIVSSNTVIERNKLLKTLSSLSGEKSNLEGNDMFIAAQKILKRLFPNFFSLASYFKTVDVRPTLISHMKYYLNNLDDYGLERYEKIAPYVREKYLKGELNPILFSYAISRPDHFVKILENKNPLVISSLQRLKEIFTEIKTIAEDHGCKVIVIDMPLSIYVSEKYAKNHKDMGLAFVKDSWTSDISLEAVKQPALDAGVYFIPNLSYFRNNCQNECYYEFDGHINVNGHELIAANVIEKLQHILENNEVKSN